MILIPPEPSLIGHHGTLCCSVAKLDITTRCSTREGLIVSLTEVPRVITWGPTRWPTTWCKLANDDGSYAGDCGVHAAVATEIAHELGYSVERAYLVLAAGHARTRHWAATWRGAHLEPAWLDTDDAFHEVLRISGIGWWDPSEARQFDGLGAVLEGGRVTQLNVAWPSRG